MSLLNAAFLALTLLAIGVVIGGKAAEAQVREQAIMCHHTLAGEPYPAFAALDTLATLRAHPECAWWINQGVAK